MSVERELWSLYEPAHAVVYFEPSVAGCLAADGLHGFWNGYFAGRAAPLGAVGAEPVTALFFGFAPDMVTRALPKVWSRITPDRAVQARLAAVGALLTPLLGKGSHDDVRRATDALVRAASQLVVDGRALAAAWQAVEVPDDLATRLWWAATVLREHRGDGHVLAATHAGLTGLETTLTHIGAGVVTRETMQPNRGWTDEQWEAATEGLVRRGLLDATARLTPDGQVLRGQIETDTDRLCRQGAAALTDDLPLLRDVLGGLARAIIASGALPAGNPMGLPRPA